MNSALILLLASLSINIAGDVFDSLGGLFVVVIFGAAMVGVISLVLGVVRAVKTPLGPPIKRNLEAGRWVDSPYEGPMYGDLGWPDSGSHSSVDFSTSDGGGACDSGGFDGGDCSCD
jgi:hypothetical protein